MFFWHKDVSDFIPSFVMVTISPGSTSLINSAPTVSRAHVSDDKKYALSLLPMQSGLNPKGSLAPISFLGLITISEYAPLIFFIAFLTASSTAPVLSLSLAIRYAITSESIVVWNIAPVYESSSLSSTALRRLPLCAMPSVPLT